MKTETASPPPNPAHIRATAWALRQLSPEETTDFAAEMAADPVLAAYAREMQEFSHLLAAEFTPEEETLGLPHASRERLVSALSQAKPARQTKPLHQGFLRTHWKSLGLTTAAAAGIILTLRPAWIAPLANPTISAGKAGSESEQDLFKSMDEVPFVARNDLKPASPNLPVSENITWPSQPGATRTYPGPNPTKQELYMRYTSPPAPVSAPSPEKAVDELSSTLAPASLSAKAKELVSANNPSYRRRVISPEGTAAELGGDQFYTTERDLSLLRNKVAIGPASETGDFDTGVANAPVNAESYKPLPPNPFNEVTAVPLSTFSIDVDTASYANVRRFLNAGQRPPRKAVRLEELVNYFPYEETPPQEGKPFAVKVDVTSAPWNPAHRLARVALKGKEIATAQRPPSNLVFLVDVSGSMNEPNKLPLVQQSLRLLTERLTENDHVSLVVYAGNTGVVLPSTNGQEKGRIQNAIDSLTSGGSTNGAGGITAAYEEATAHFIKDGVNRVILATDGDFNVGASSHGELLTLIQEKAKTGVFLSVLGYGMGNLKDDTMELLADKGNGNYGYIDSLSEARKTLVEQMSGTLVTIAKDVKIQIEFNPAAVKSYRLLGYENRLLAKEDFNDDKKDAGEIGAGHNVTALYEITPAGTPDAAPVPVVDGLKYQQVPAVVAPKTEPTPAAQSGEMMNVKLRWKQPAGEVSELLEVPVKDAAVPLDQAPQETRWATAVAGFAQLLRGDAPPALTWESVRQLARSAKGTDALGYRGEFLQLIDKAESLSR